MLIDYVKRGLKAGTVGGFAYGTFVALVGNPLITFAETFEQSHGHAHEAGPVVSGAITNTVSIGAGVLLGLLVGAVIFGIAYYFLEPALPGAVDTKSYVIAAAGFVTIFGAPWVLLPPQPPGIEQTLATEIRITWYVIMMGVGALACGLSGYAYVQLRTRYRRPFAFVGAAVPIALIPAVALLGPANPVSGPIPGGLADTFRAIVAFGQIGLWLVIASVHAWFVRREVHRGSPSTTIPNDEQFAVSAD